MPEKIEKSTTTAWGIYSFSRRISLPGGQPARAGDEAVGNYITAHWWYGYPQDLIKNPDDTGTGEIRWFSSGEALKIVLFSLEADAILPLQGCIHLVDLIRMK